ncbi:MAG: creatininase [Deltaproteobacteria bacterium SG8_13]|nr:MAG: creatininase [Deltaproteobacteria bacterium SG8_13]
MHNAQTDPLKPLRVFDRLEVGPIRIEPRRLVAPYRLHFAGQETGIDLICRYEEDVFTSQEPGSQNLAALIAAQVAINYGLFCREIVFNGLFDDLDRRFIREMIENTAREILVKKFLEPNPFLTPDAPRITAVKLPRYAHAAVQFKGVSTKTLDEKWRLWATDRERHCVLSSGGKDSLLSYGLLDELGREVHPIFVNESGRHWFTALNAYRHFKDNVPHTARVWVNSDRVFNWMLQQMPFIRKDFSAVRSDEYPIRLWTVAVFVFGILPLVRKKGIGRILIGDEYDTTVRANRDGVFHYDGLYDQSIYFDSNLSRYYLRKGWSVSQFSILRPLSELLIQKTLAERYPQLQKHQLSCHAAHKQSDERIHPCGRCEKCRRIVSMLTAIDVDPKHCGYSDRQIGDCLEAFFKRGVLQEEEGRQQLGFMLLKKEGGQPPGNRQHRFKEHPEVLQLRFDPVRSPIDGIPVDLRVPLYRVFLQHSNGAVRRTNRSWKAFELLQAKELGLSYTFELNGTFQDAFPGATADFADPQSCLWGEMTWEDAEKRLRQVDIALLPVGAIEQHGPHLPLDTDAFDSDYLARRVAQACSPPRPLVLPPIAYGVSYHHDDFKGTISIDNQTLTRLVYDIGLSAARNGVKKLVIINGHGGNAPAINHAAQMINRDAHIFVCVDTGETSDVDIYRFIETPNDVHAGEIETSTSLAVRPGLVRMEKAEKSVPEFSSRYLDFTGKRGITWYAFTHRISSSGVMGDPTKASAEKGEKIWEIMVAHLAALVEELKNMTLDEIHHKRY